MRATFSSPAARLKSATSTFAPSAAKRRAVAPPIPIAPPVTMATCPCKLDIFAPLYLSTDYTDFFVKSMDLFSSFHPAVCRRTSSGTQVIGINTDFVHGFPQIFTDFEAQLERKSVFIL
jgi:cellulose synthase/poly-beta-1,6-N-acetylglucosamine synthase-like glycosyltransferase